MALPTTLTGFAWPTDGIAWLGPFISSGGNVYVMGMADGARAVSCHQAGDILHVVGEGAAAGNAANFLAYKATDPTSSFTTFADTDFGTVNTVYNTFDMSTDAWGTKVINFAGGSAVNQGISVAKRSTGSDVITFFNRPGAVSMGKTYGRIGAARLAGGVTPGADTTIGIAAGTTTQVAESVDSAVLGSSDRVHLFWNDGTNLKGRCVKSSDNLDGTQPATAAYTASTTLQSAGAADQSIHHAGQAFLSSGSVLAVPYISASPVAAGVRIATASDADTPTWSQTTVSAAAALFTVAGSTTTSAKLGGAPYDGTNKTVAWLDQTTTDPFYDKDTGGGFGTDTTIEATTATFISANVYQRGTNVVLAVVYDKAGTWVYNEVVLRSTGLAVTPTGPTVTVAAGTITIARGITPTGATVTVTPGTPTIVHVTPVTPTGATVTVTPGTPALRLNVTPTGATVSVTPGTPAIAQSITPTGATVTATPGTPTFLHVSPITPTGATVSVTPGTPALALSITPSATVTVTPGTPALALAITPTGATVTVAPGTPTLDLSIAPTGATVSVVAGTATVANASGPQDVTPTGATVTVLAGTPAIALSIAPTGATVSVTPGTPALALSIAPTATVDVTPGTPSFLNPSPQAITPTGATVSITPGTPAVALSIAPTGPTVTVTPGTVTLDLNVTPTGATVNVTPGTASVTAAAADQAITPTGATVTVAPGTPALALSIAPSATVSVTAGTPAIALNITPTGPVVTITTGTPGIALTLAPDGATVTITPGTPALALAVSPIAALVTVLAGTVVVERAALGGGFPPFRSTDFRVRPHESALESVGRSTLTVVDKHSGDFTVRPHHSDDFEVNQHD